LNTKRILTLFFVVSLLVMLAAIPTVTQGQSDSPLGCQRNNPERLDCSSLEVIGICEGDVAVFTIRNTGEPGEGDMRAPTEYRLIVDGVVVETGTVQLAGGESIEIRYSGGGTVTLEVDQQIGHPGSSRPQATLTCTGATSTPATPTDEPPTPTPTPTDEPPTNTPTPTEEPTEEPTPTPGAPNIIIDVDTCLDDGTIYYIIFNAGEDMLQESPYRVEDRAGNIVDSGTFFLRANEFLELTYQGYTRLTLYIEEWTSYAYLVVCDGDEEPTPTPTPTEEPPTETPTPTPTPTDEPTHTPTPTDEPVTPTDEPPTNTPTHTPTPTPTDEPPTPTFTPTSNGPRGCQRNNRERLDCSSLEVTGVCEGSVAVFTIYNSGEPGEGDMVTPTMYRLSVDGTVIEIGSVQLDGGESMEVRYDGTGRVTLEADQQIGHPGRSRPRATLTCSR